jgi:hypothetical protein
MMQIHKAPQEGQAQRRFPSFAALREKLMTTSPANDLLNPRNAERWYNVFCEAGEANKPKRVMLALYKLDKLCRSKNQLVQLNAAHWAGRSIDVLADLCKSRSRNGNNLGARTMLTFLTALATSEDGLSFFAAKTNWSKTLEDEARRGLAGIYLYLQDGTFAERQISEEAGTALFFRNKATGHLFDREFAEELADLKLQIQASEFMHLKDGFNILLNTRFPTFALSETPAAVDAFVTGQLAYSEKTWPDAPKLQFELAAYETALQYIRRLVSSLRYVPGARQAQFAEEYNALARDYEQKLGELKQAN